MRIFPRNAMFAATLLACASLAHAEDAAKPAAPAGPTLTDILTNSGIDLKGYIDVAAEGTTLKSSPIGLGQAGIAGNPYKVFDADHAGLNLHQIGLTVDKLPKEGFGGLVNLTIGKDANVIKSYDISTLQTTYFDITQGFAQYAHGPLTLIAGKFATLAGAEVIDSSANTNVSRSVLFGQIPFTHTGLRATYALDDTTNLIAGINNGWDQLKDYNTQKTIELGITANPVKPLTLAASIYSGVEPVNSPAVSQAGFDIGQGDRTLVDVVATYAVSDKLSLILNLDYAVQEGVPTPNGTVRASWYGAAGYVNYAIDDSTRISLRAEDFKDANGYRTGTPGVGQGDTEFTLTYGYSPAKNFELRTEVRYDKASNDVFTKTDGTVTASGTTVALQGVYKF